ncbi:hypothetical protein FOZ61_010838 [Perkinsus olseni]|uniref:Nucleotide-diphospho-sugar transferase domain-containing protein n=1 Tax=Perkinsus olseni TaxID=32597 RepID=A0A7J6M1T2_PEROL|nr:hypothetical protein FOZ61_010838 [Perkinsus olseni]
MKPLEQLSLLAGVLARQPPVVLDTLPDFDCTLSGNELWDDLHMNMNEYIGMVQSYSSSDRALILDAFQATQLNILYPRSALHGNRTIEDISPDTCPYLGHREHRSVSSFLKALVDLAARGRSVSITLVLYYSYGSLVLYSTAAVLSDLAGFRMTAKFWFGKLGEMLRGIYWLGWLRLIPLLNSRWSKPLLSMTAAYNLHVREHLDDPCPRYLTDELTGEVVADWRAFHNVTRSLKELGLTQWILQTQRTAFIPKILIKAAAKMDTEEACPLGSMAVLGMKLLLSVQKAHDQTINSADGFLELMSTTPARVLWSSSWPWWTILSVIRDVKYAYSKMPYAMDLLPSELTSVQTEYGLDGEKLFWLGPYKHAELIRRYIPLHSGQQRRHSPAFIGAVQMVIDFLETHPSEKIIYVTLVWGRLTPYIRGFGTRMTALSLPLVIFCIDEPALLACEEARLSQAHSSPLYCLRGQTIGFFNKFTLLSVLLQLGIQVVVMDFDVIFFKSPTEHLLEQAHRDNADILVSRTFGDGCMNIGLFYSRPTQSSVSFYLYLIKWLWHHPYDHDQWIFQVLLETGNSANVNSLRTIHPPYHPTNSFNERLNYPDSIRCEWLPADYDLILDPVNAYITNRVYEDEGWTGDLSDIVAFHFLDGQGAVNDEIATRKEYLDLWSLFYNGTEHLLGDLSAGPLWETIPGLLQVLEDARRDERPPDDVTCLTWDPLT